jgi:hypothetical protein
MRRYLLVIVILLLGIWYDYAEGFNTGLTEYAEIVRTLDQLADKFKAETGFRGEIKYNLEKMRLGFFEGKFADIQITADADTSAFRDVFEQILTKVLPYTFAKREQFSRSKITNNLGRVKTVYYQQINGYRVEGAGWLSIVYETGRNSFVIGNTTVELPNEPLREIITEAEAYQLALDLYKKTEWYTEKYYISCKKVIAYKSRTIDGISQPYRLCWRISFPHMNYFIDAISKEIYSEKSIILH